MASFVWAVVLALAAQTNAVRLDVSHRARAIAPGEVVVVDVKAPTPLRTVQGRWLGQAIAFYPIGASHWQGLAPIDLSAKPGVHTLHISATAEDGRSLTRDYVMTVLSRTFAVRRISVEDRFAEPPKEELARIDRERQTVEAIFAAAPRERLWADAFVAPVPGKSTSSFGRRSIVNGQPRSPHSGADFQAASGTIVVAPNRGRVALAADLYFPGRTVILDHGAGLYSYLAHLSELRVAEGELVERGQTVGLSGASGRVTGPHLHWTLRVGAARVDPLSLLSVLGDENARGAARPR